MANYNIDSENRQVTISDGKNSVNISFNELESIKTDTDMISFREDVKTEIGEMIDRGEIPEKASFNAEFIEAVTESYANHRESLMDNEWMLCLENAFAENPYDNFSKN